MISFIDFIFLQVDFFIDQFESLYNDKWKIKN